MDMRFRTQDVTSFYRTGSPKTVARELATYKLHLMAVQEVRWVDGGSQKMIIHFLFGNQNANHHLGTELAYIRKSLVIRYM